MGLISIRGYRNIDKIDGRIENTTVILEATAKYYVSVIVEETLVVDK